MLGKGRCGFPKVKWLAKVTHLIHVSFCLLIRGQVIYCLYYSEAPCYNGISTGFEVRDTWDWHKDLKFVSHAIGPVSSNFLIWEVEIIISAFLGQLEFKWDMLPTCYLLHSRCATCVSFPFFMSKLSLNSLCSQIRREEDQRTYYRELKS